MEKLLSSLLCCSSSSKDDSNDKYHSKSLTSGNSKKNGSTNRNAKLSAKSSRSSQRKANSSNVQKDSSEIDGVPEENKTQPNTSSSNNTSNTDKDKKISQNKNNNNNNRDSITAVDQGHTTKSNKNSVGKNKVDSNGNIILSQSKIDLLDDDHSINETDTITNTNEESTPNSHSENKNIIANQESPQETQEIPSINEDKLIYNHDPKSSKKQIVNSQEINKKLALAQDPQHPLDQASAATDEDDEEVEEYDEAVADGELEDDQSYLDLTKLQEGQSFNPESGWLLGLKDEKVYGTKKCLILDLDETFVHSSFKYLRTADFVIPVEIDNQVHHVYVIKRPGVDEFLQKVGKWYEVVVFTASVSKYGDPLLDKLDIHKSVHHRLFRDSCYNYQGNFIKNLSQIGRPLADSIIIDNSPASYIFHPQHSIPISSWFSDTHDNELLDLLPFLEDIAKPNVDDVGLVLDITI